MRRVEFDELKIKAQCRAIINPYYFETFLAFDTETINGKAVLICDNNDRHIYPKNFEECIKFLTYKPYRGQIAWYYNISHDIESILKWLDQSLIQELADKGEIRNLKLNKIKTSITVVDKKFFSITRNKNQFLAFDIGNFLPGGLDKNAKKYLNKEKPKIPIDFRKDSKAKIKKFLFSKEGVYYCKHDANLTGELAKQFVETCNSFKMFPKNFSSSASVATHYFQSHVEIPTLNQIAGNRNLSKKLAYTAYKGGFITAFKRGYFDNVVSYDINSAYPYNVSKLANLIHGDFNTTFNEIPIDAYYGWLECTIHNKNKKPYGPGYFSPLPVYIKKFNKNFYLVGKIKTTITLLEYETLKNDFDIEVGVGCYWIPDKIDLMYNEAVNNLYNLRKTVNDKLLDVFLKTNLNGFYGKLIQKIPKKVNGSKVYNEFVTGNLFNPFHASYITAGCRCQIYNMIKKCGAHNVISVMTDSILFEKDPKIKTSKDLGAWSQDFPKKDKADCIMIGSGLYTLRENGNVKTATRGFKLSKKLDFFKLCEKFYDQDKIKLDQNVRLTYREALRIKNFTGWNIIGKSTKRININADNKRIWSDIFNTCGEVLEKTIDSMPINVTM